MAAADLEEAALQAQDNLFQRWVANNLQSRLTQFCTNLLPTFPDQDVNARPVSNWLTVLMALAAQMSTVTGAGGPFVLYTQFNTSAQYMYHLCFVAQALNTQNLITNTQATAILTEYNNNFP